MSTAGAARPKITSNRGRRIWRPTAPHARRPRPTSSGLFLHAGAYWLMWGLRASMPKRSMWRVRAVRHIAPAAHQGRRPRRRDEDDDQGSPADVVPRPGYSASCARAHTAPRHLSDGAQRPERRAHPVNPQTFSSRPLARRRRRCGASANTRKQKKITRPQRFARRNGQPAA